MAEKFTLFTWSVSLYSAKARSYLIKQHIDFNDVSPAHRLYEDRVRPAIGRWIIPVMMTPTGEIVQDGADIIDWFERRDMARISAYPESPRHLIASLIMDMFGGEGLLRPAMHYRWNFDADNLAFITQQFGLFALPHLPPEQRHDMAVHMSNRMRKAAVAFGVVEETIPAIEAAYLETLAELEAHFSHTPYLLGGVPTIGDYGLFASLFPHLGRDPHPLQIMQQKAPMVFRWTERMRNPSSDMVEFLDHDERLFPDDNIPETLVTLLRRVALDYLPEIKAMIAFTNNWLMENKPEPGAIVGGKASERGIGFCAFAWRGVTVSAIVMPYRIFMLQRIQDAYDRLPAPDRADVDKLLAETGLSDIITARSHQRVERENNREVWGATQK